MPEKPNHKIRVGFVMHLMQVAGAEVLVKQMIRQLSDQIEPTILCLDGVGELGEQLIEEGVPLVNMERRPGIDLSVARKLASAVCERKIDVLHAHQYTPFFYSALARLIYRAKSKILFTEHGRHYPDVVSWKRRFANRLLLSRYAEISTACCEFSAEALRRVEGFPRTETLPNGVDLSALPPRGEQDAMHRLRDELNMEIHRPYAVCVARFHPVKDHQTLIQAWKHVHDVIPDAGLLLIGDGQLREATQRLVTQLDLNSCIEFRGIQHNVSDYLRASNVFTLTSVSEAASLTLLEAMASGCPSVLTDVGGNAEHVRHGVEGYLEPRGDSKAIAARLVQLLEDRDIADAMGRRARQRVEREFSLSKVIAQYANHFNALV